MHCRSQKLNLHNKIIAYNFYTSANLRKYSFCIIIFSYNGIFKKFLVDLFSKGAINRKIFKILKI